MSTYDDFYGKYGAGAAPMREALGFGGQNNIDILAGSRVSGGGGSDGGQGDSMQPDAALQAMMDKGLISYGDNGLGGDQQGQGYTVNWDKMPKTKFGNNGVSAYDPSQKLYNPNLKYDDPNFGWITPTANVDSRAGIWDTVYNIAPALFTMGMGAVAAPVAALGTAGSFAAQLPRALQMLTQMMDKGPAKPGAAGGAKPTATGGGKGGGASGIAALLTLLARARKGGGGHG